MNRYISMEFYVQKAKSVTLFDPLRIIFRDEDHHSVTSEPAYNDITLRNISYITSDILLCQLITHW